MRDGQYKSTQDHVGLPRARRNKVKFGLTVSPIFLAILQSCEISSSFFETIFKGLNLQRICLTCCLTDSPTAVFRHLKNLKRWTRTRVQQLLLNTITRVQQNRWTLTRVQQNRWTLTRVQQNRWTRTRVQQWLLNTG